MLTVTEAEPAHPLAEIPITLYTVVLFGVTVMLAPVCPVDHTYDCAPLAVRMMGVPPHTFCALALAVI
jgi:hypothetical protein